MKRSLEKRFLFSIKGRPSDHEHGEVLSEGWLALLSSLLFFVANIYIFFFPCHRLQASNQSTNSSIHALLISRLESEKKASKLAATDSTRFPCMSFANAMHVIFNGLIVLFKTQSIAKDYVFLRIFFGPFPSISLSLSHSFFL